LLTAGDIYVQNSKSEIRNPELEVAMSNEVWRTILAVVVGAHGIGHVLFLVPLLGIADWGQSTRSWLLTDLVGDGVTRILGSLLWLVAIVGFVAVAVGMFGQVGWWRGLAVGSAAVSILGLVLFWSNSAASSAFSALTFDVAVLGALLLLRWPPSSLVGP
jgi:hypothetical protein